MAEVICPACGNAFDATSQAVRTTEAAEATEAMIDGQRSVSDTHSLVREALAARVKQQTGKLYAWVYIADMTGDQVVYTCESDSCDAANHEQLLQCSYAVDAAGTVTLGDPAAVVRTYAPAPPGEIVAAGDAVLTEATDRIPGRVIEAKGADSDGGRIFRVRIIAYGDSKNGRRYTEAVLKAAAPLYEGAKAYDHHRTADELKTSTISGLVGYYRNVEATTDGLDADLHLLPSATHTAEALDASLAAQDQGLPPLVGVSHDVHATYKAVHAGGRHLQEATAIVKVNSADIVADPAAGGLATRMVAGGEDTAATITVTSGADPAQVVAALQKYAQQNGEVRLRAPESSGTSDPASTKESAVTIEELLALLKSATPQQLQESGLGNLATLTAPPGDPVPVVPTTESTPATPAVPAAVFPKASFMGRMAIRAAVEDANMPPRTAEALTDLLPEQFTESDLSSQMAGLKTLLAGLERADLAPTVTAVVTKESFDKKTAALDAMFAGDHSKGYRSFKEAFTDVTGQRPRAFDEDFNRTIMRESIGQLYDSAVRSTESLTSASWAQVLGDAVTRRMMAEYSVPALQDWRKVVSDTPPITDFRTQRITRIGGYGTLPTVNEGAPYQPLTSPGDEEATYAIIKRGGTDDITLEMVANDDMRSIVRLPRLLGRAAAITLYRFVFDLLTANAAVTYDSVALFHASHANTTTGALTQTNLSAARAAMRAQARYGDSTDILSLVPRTLIVPSALEEIAYQLTASAVAIPATPAGPSNTPNIHNRMNEPIVVDYYSDANDWFTIADPAACPTIEVGFYQGRQDPELFTQADPTVGSMFNADKQTWKLRHVYGSAVLDHRGFYRSTN